jgi:hypothetical protein
VELTILLYLIVKLKIRGAFISLLYAFVALFTDGDVCNVTKDTALKWV